MRYCSSLVCCAILLAGCLPQQSDSGSSAEPANADSTFEARVAGVGVGQQGRSLDNEEGVGKIIAGPAIAYFNAREKIAFEIAVPHALNLYMGFHGEYPKSHEEFMEKVIHENRIELPRLPRNAQYRYHPDDHQLWVEPIESSDAQAPGN